jgi:elongation factor 1-beta
MAKVAATLKVMPNSPELDLDDLEERLSNALPEGAKINNVDREDVAFGLVALLPTVLIPDDAGGTDGVEEAFGAVEGVESVGVENVTRI